MSFLWASLLQELDCTHVCVKPAADGCSTGVARLDHEADLTAYVAAVRDRRSRLDPAAMSTGQGGEMAVPPPKNFLLEPFIDTDPILIRRRRRNERDSRSPKAASLSGHESCGEAFNKAESSKEEESGILERSSEDASTTELVWAGHSRWVEITVGVLGLKGAMKALSPSITVKESGHVLSLEEKFQGGTGVNLTPPPPEIVR